MCTKGCGPLDSGKARRALSPPRFSRQYRMKGGVGLQHPAARVAFNASTAFFVCAKRRVVFKASRSKRRTKSVAFKASRSARVAVRCFACCKGRTVWACARPACPADMWRTHAPAAQSDRGEGPRDEMDSRLILRGTRWCQIDSLLILQGMRWIPV